MSKRIELQKEYYQKHGNYKGSGSYSDHYVRWLEERVLSSFSGSLPLPEKLIKVLSDLWNTNQKIKAVKIVGAVKNIGITEAAQWCKVNLFSCNDR